MTYRPKTADAGNTVTSAQSSGTFLALRSGDALSFITRSDFLGGFSGKAAASVEGAIVTTVGPTITDGSGNVYSINAAAQVVTNGVAETFTSTVVEIAYHNGQLYQKNAAGSWYTRATPAAAYTFTSDPFAVATPSGGPSTYPQGTVGPYGGIGDTGTGAGPQAYLYGRSLGDLFGTYTYPNPGGLDNGYTLKQNIDKLISVTGVKPKTMNAFNSAGYTEITNVGTGTFAYGWHNDDPTISGPNGYMRPIIGVKLGFQNQGWDNPATYDAIAAGTYDSQYLAEVNKWIEFGYPHLVYRYAYEMNGTFMPDYMGGTIADNHRFAAAMRHIILLVKNRCAQAGVRAEFCFNPTYMNYTDTDIMEAYPGDDVIDIIDCDQYNPCYNRTLQNYSADGVPLGTFAATQFDWMQNANNRKKFWNYPGIKDDGNNHYSYGAWSALRTIAIAKAKGKAIAFSECGTGASTNTNAFFGNDPTWVQWFWGICQSAISQGVPIAHINIWNIYASDGQWMYNAPDTFDPQPLVRTAYRKYFGDGGVA